MIPVRELVFIYESSAYAARAPGISYLTLVVDVSDAGRGKDGLL